MRGRRPLRVVPAARRRRRLPFVLASFVLVGALVVGVVSLQAVLSQTSFRMEELAKRNAGLQQQYGDLQEQVARLSSPGRIVREATRLGLRSPDPANVHTLSGDATMDAPPAANASYAVKGLLGAGP